MEQKREPSYYFNSLSLEEQRKMYPTAFGSVLFHMYKNLNRFVNEMRATRFIFYKDRYYIYRGDAIVFKAPQTRSQAELSKFTPEEREKLGEGTAAAMVAFFKAIPLIIETDDHVQKFMRIK
jgi:hypothetical protein